MRLDKSNSDLENCLKQANPSDHLGINGETEDQRIKREECINKYEKSIMKNFLFPFISNYLFLTEKWWHRFFVVIYVILMIIVLLISALIFSSVVDENQHNITIKNNLREFSKNSEKTIANTIPLFLNQADKIACFESSKISYLSRYDLETKSICSSDIESNADKIAQSYLKDHTASVDEKKKLILDILAKDSEKRYCFIHNDMKCASDKIISYNRNPLFYLQVFAYSLIVACLFSYILQILYYKGLIYIIYGKKNIGK